MEIVIDKVAPIFLGEQRGYAFIPSKLNEDDWVLLMKMLELLKPAIVVLDNYPKLSTPSERNEG